MTMFVSFLATRVGGWALNIRRNLPARGRSAAESRLRTRTAA